MYKLYVSQTDPATGTHKYVRVASVESENLDLYESIVDLISANGSVHVYMTKQQMPKTLSSAWGLSLEQVR